MEARGRRGHIQKILNVECSESGGFFIAAAERFLETSLLVPGQPPACNFADSPPEDTAKESQSSVMTLFRRCLDHDHQGMAGFTRW